MAYFFGEFEQSIDAKHRLVINSALREQISPSEDGETFVLTLGPDRHLWLYPELYFRRLISMLSPSPLPDRQRQKIRLLTALARVLKPDAQGRVVLPEKSMQRAIISDQVTLVGATDHIELWPTEEWTRHLEESLPSYPELYEGGIRLTGERGGTT